MRFGLVNNSTSILADITFWTGADSSTFTVADRTRGVNEWYRIVNQRIWRASGKWQFDDSNYSTLPIATADLVDGQEDYSLPSVAQKLMSVEVLDDNADWQLLTPYDPEQLPYADEEFEETNGSPRFYDVMGNSIRLKPAPASGDVTLTSGLRLTLSRNISPLATSSSSPGFTEDLHRIIPIGVSYDYLISNNGNPDQLNRLSSRIRKYEKMIDDFYGTRNLDDPVKFMPRQDSKV